MLHDSRSLAYRTPFGAVPVGTEVTLSVDAEYADDCTLLLRREGESCKEISMAYMGNSRYACTVKMPEEPTLMWYAFRAHFGGIPVCYGGSADGLGGIGEEYTGEPVWYQITVYLPCELPAWYGKGVVYQIFPDRFCRGSDFSRRWKDKCASPLRGGAKYVLSEDWDDVPYYTKRDDGLVSRWQFYGGTLTGIREKLDYIRALGATVIYLNPIFLAASNHRYDTADYFRIDPLLGDEEAFRALCNAAAERGIRIMLDGVFSHTGADSRYFNRYGTFAEPGAWQDTPTVYDIWYRFKEPPEEYECWWGVKDLPNVEENDPGYREMICGENGVIRKWLRLGASGWRLDVADELPDSFIEEIRAAAAAEKPDAVVIGEVWEDASNKVSYDARRTYLWGRGLHSVMTYPFRQGVMDFVLGKISAETLCRTLLSLQENYPPWAFEGALNLIGSHDRPRILTQLGQAEEPETVYGKETFRLAAEKRTLAQKRLALLWAIQFAMPGVPCIYYGDETGLEGFADPLNRGSFPWGKEDAAMQAQLREFASFRQTHKALRDGALSLDFAGEDVLILRRFAGDEEVTLCINRAEELRKTEIRGAEDLEPLNWRFVL